jgi:hypothetical protein
MDAQTKHDFINNSLRLEVLMKLVCKDLDQKINPSEKYLNDLGKFLDLQKELLNKIIDQVRH